MYTCNLCKKPQPSHTAARKVILKARKVEYFHPNETVSIGFEPVLETLSCLVCPAPEVVIVGETKMLTVVPKKRKMKREYETPRQAKVDSQ